MPTMTGAFQNPVIAKPRQISAQHGEVEAILGLHEIRARLDLGLQPVGLPFGLRVLGRIRGADEEPGRGRHGPAGGERAFLPQASGRRHQGPAIDVVDRLGLRLVAVLRIVAMEAKNVGDAECRRADQVALEGEAIPVAHGELEHRLDAVLGQDSGTSDGRHVGPGACPVGDVHGIRQALEEPARSITFSAEAASGGEVSAVITKVRRGAMP